MEVDCRQLTILIFSVDIFHHGQYEPGFFSLKCSGMIVALSNRILVLLTIQFSNPMGSERKKAKKEKGIFLTGVEGVYSLRKHGFMAYGLE